MDVSDSDAVPFWEELRRRATAQAALRGVNAAVVGLLLAEPFSAQPAGQVGAYLVELNATRAEALRRTLLVLTDRLLVGQPISPEAGGYRLSRLLIELATGWADAVHRHILAAQEEIHRAFDTARRDQQQDGQPPPNPWFE